MQNLECDIAREFQVRGFEYCTHAARTQTSGYFKVSEADPDFLALEYSI